MSADSVVDTAQLAEYVLRLGDSALVLSHRLSEWVTHAPTLEEEMAIANVALDLLGQARALLSYAGALEGGTRDEDALAYRRDAGEFRNLLLVEQPNGDFAQTVCRQFLYDAYAVELWARLRDVSSDETLRGIGGKAVKESTYHVSHSGAWVVRLGDGTDESRARMLSALEELWPVTGELFMTDDVDRAVAAAGVAPLAGDLSPAWRSRVEDVLGTATLPVPSYDAWMQRGGKQGRHTEHLGFLLAQMQFLQRAYPGGTW